MSRYLAHVVARTGGAPPATGLRGFPLRWLPADDIGIWATEWVGEPCAESDREARAGVTEDTDQVVVRERVVAGQRGFAIPARRPETELAARDLLERPATEAEGRPAGGPPGDRVREKARHFFRAVRASFCAIDSVAVRITLRPR